MQDTEVPAGPDLDKSPRFRSPPYPAIPLSKAVDRASSLYAKALHHAVPASVVADAWGYTVKSSGLFAGIAALKQFGLLHDDGSGDKRRFKLADSAIRIVRDPDPKSEKRRAALKAAALAPRIHAELWGQYGAAGAAGSMDMTVKSYLTLFRADEGAAPYSDNAAAELIEEFKQTVAYAGLVEAGPPDSDDVSSPDEIGEGNANLSDQKDKNVVQGAAAGHDARMPPAPASLQKGEQLNDIRAEMAGGLVRISALLDKDGLEKLEKKIAALKTFLAD